MPLVVLNESSECAGCGRCCSQMPGLTWPEDWGTNREQIAAAIIDALESGWYCFDCWDGDVFPNSSLDRILMVRPQVRGMNRLFDPSWGGPCSMLGPTGCELSFESRPFICRDLTPHSKKCFSQTGKGMDKTWSAKAWRPYAGMTECILAELEAKRAEVAA